MTLGDLLERLQFTFTKSDPNSKRNDRGGSLIVFCDMTKFRPNRGRSVYLEVKDFEVTAVRVRCDGHVDVYCEANEDRLVAPPTNSSAATYSKKRGTRLFEEEQP